MLVRITGPAAVAHEDGRPGDDPALVRELDGTASEEECGDHLAADLADLGITGGKVRLAWEAAAGRWRVVTEYRAPKKLRPAQLKRLVEDTVGQWSDGIGEGCFDASADRLGVVISLQPLDGEKPQVEQIDDGTKPSRPKTGLAKAARDGDLPALRKHLQAGADLEARLQGYTALHLAVLYGHAEAALELIERGADVAAPDPQSKDPLLLAATSNKLGDADAARVARALLSRGVSPYGARGPDANPQRGEYTALYMADLRRKTALAAVLREFGAER